MALHIEPIAPALGAEIHGLDLREPLGAGTVEILHDALMRHQVIFLRGQDITPEQQVRFARHFGEPMVHPFIGNLPEWPQVSVIEHDERKRPTENHWHTDVSFAIEPAMGSILLARHVPANGGDTMWANMYEAYDTLSGAMQRFLGEHRAVHDFTMAFGPTVARLQADPEKMNRKRAEHPPVEHPIVRTHPVTGRKALYVNSAFTSHVKDMTASESESLLAFLYRHLQTPEFTCRFRWQRHSMAFWDNRCTQHYALADYFPQRRLMHRIALKGERPV
ncbi:MAG: taurine dioxygenase [Lautropia sp.]